MSIIRFIGDEVWKDVVEYEGYYQVSDLGNVRSETRTLKLPSGQTRTYQGRILIPWLDKSGYKIVNLSKNGCTRQGKVHQLVLKAFIGPCPEGHVVRHFPDRDPANNRLDNIQWGTKQQNSGPDRIVHGTSNDGYRCGNSKLNLKQVREIRQRAGYRNYSSLAREFGVSGSVVSDIVNRKSWKLWE